MLSNSLWALVSGFPWGWSYTWIESYGLPGWSCSLIVTPTGKWLSCKSSLISVITPADICVGLGPNALPWLLSSPFWAQMTHFAVEFILEPYGGWEVRGPWENIFCCVWSPQRLGPLDLVMLRMETVSGQCPALEMTMREWLPSSCSQNIFHFLLVLTAKVNPWSCLLCDWPNI